MDIVAEQRLRRFRVLKYLYERTGGHELEHVPHEDVMQHVGLLEDEFMPIFLYLMNEGLADGTRGTVCLSHVGVVEIEAALSQPDTPTQHFPVNIIHIGQMSHSQIQQGTVSSTQSGTFTLFDLAAVGEFIRNLKGQLPLLPLTGDDEAVAQSDIATIEMPVVFATPEGGDHQRIPPVDQEHRRRDRGQHGGIRHPRGDSETPWRVREGNLGNT